MTGLYLPTSGTPVTRVTVERWSGSPAEPTKNIGLRLDVEDVRKGTHIHESADSVCRAQQNEPAP